MAPMKRRHVGTGECLLHEDQEDEQADRDEQQRELHLPPVHLLGGEETW
jgi:hypothetical protein